ncbi:MAG: dependent oxidoreductase [Gemmataceae bacterium]|nr:dependent oxidoreductase [Gemmataceae bacterium]
MTRFDCDLAILGSGFGGTLLAIIARRLGYSVVLLERGTHPRFAIGESSTPLADFKLAAIADRFGLDWLRPFAKYGPWKAAYPHIHCGLKRGFSFFRHERDRPFAATDGNTNSLLVAASPDADHSDTHWFRADFDANLVSRAVGDGIPYLDQFEVTSVRHDDRGWELGGARADGEVNIRAGFVVDATGTGQVLAKALGLELVDPSTLRARSRAIYSHFTGVARWHDVLEAEQGPAGTAGHTFPCDAAALHQIIDHGWMWVLRFDHGITSAGFSLDPDAHPIRPDESPEMEWRRLLNSYPSLARQFAAAEPVRPFVRTGRLQRRLSRASGPDWALLPHTAGFLDAWLSPGIAQTLFAVNRLGRILAEDWRGPGRERRLTEYGRAVLRELVWVDEITGTCFACFDRFPVMTTASMIYFVAAHYCEERERAGRAGPDDAFLLADDPVYREIAARVFRQALTTPAADADRFTAAVRDELGPYNLCGLCEPRWRNMYPYLGTLPTETSR